MKQKQTNYLILALSIIYAIITGIQISINELLPAWLYISIAFVTIDITLFESVKNIASKLIRSYERRAQINASFSNNYLRQINIYDKFPQLNEEKQELQYELDMIQNRINIQKINIKIKRLRYFLNALDFIQMLCCACIILITPLKTSSYDAVTNKTIAVLSLISLSTTFLTLYFNNINNDIDDKVENYLSVSDFHLKILEKIDDNKKVQQNEKE